MKFYDELMKVYDLVFPLAPAKVQWIMEFIEDKGIENLLDVGCATGTFCHAMADDLSYVDGFDLDAAMIDKANRLYHKESLSYSVGNMLDLDSVFHGEQYDLITCFGNTLVHLENEQLNQVFTGIKKKLNHNGWFVGQIINYDYVLDKEIESLPLIDNEAIKFERIYRWDNEECLSFDTALHIKAEHMVYINSIHLYPIRRGKLQEKLEQAGFEDIEFYKNYKGHAAEGEHLPLIFVAKV